MSKPALGRGLGALLGSQNATEQRKPDAPAPSSSPQSGSVPSEADAGVQLVAVNKIYPSELQPRKNFPAESLEELAASIRQQGVLQPLIVRNTDRGFELIAGERRWRASQLAGLESVPVILREGDDEKVLEWMLIENLQREDLNPMEEARGYAQLIQNFKLKQEEVAARVGRSRVAVANALRLLKLPEELQQWVRNGRLSVGQAKVLLGLASPEGQKAAAQKVLKGGLSVRDTEKLVADWPSDSKPAPKSASPAPSAKRPDAHVAHVEQKIQERLGTKVALRYREGKGSLEIKFYNEDDLERVLQIIGVSMD